jgi:glycolate oxidase iron-sulfur subunit
MKKNKCVYCGMCREVCPVFKALKRETASPRAKGVLNNKKLLDNVFYLCTLCGACKKNCPAEVDLEVLEAREEIVKKGIELKSSKEMISNIRKTGNPYGKDPSKE